MRGHRGVSAPSFRDGAIPFSLIPKIKKRVRTEGTENTEKRFLGKSWEGVVNAWERQTLVQHVFYIFTGSVPERSIARLRGLPKSARWLPRDNINGHRGVSAPSFRDGAIPFSFIPKKKNGFARRAQRTQRKDSWESLGKAL